MGNCANMQVMHHNAVSYNNIGNVLYDDNEVNKALKHYKRAVKLFLAQKKGRGEGQQQQQQQQRQTTDLAKTYRNIGNVYHKMGKYKKCLEYYEKANDLDAESQSVSNKFDLSHAYNNMGTAYCSMEQFDKALDCHQQVVKILEEIIRMENNNNNQKNRKTKKVTTTTTMEDEEKEEEEEEEDHRNSNSNDSGGNIQCDDADDKDPSGTAHANLGRAYGNLAVDCYGLGDYDGAVHYQRQCLDMLQAELGKKHTNTQQAEINLKTMLSQM